MECDTTCDNQAPFVLKDATALAHVVAETYHLITLSFVTSPFFRCCVLSAIYCARLLLFIVGIMKTKAVIPVEKKIANSSAAALREHQL